MTLQHLQDKLRRDIRARIERGQTTGTALSREAGIQPGHLSNFLNSRRGLSLESMDRLLVSLEIGVLDLVDTADLQRHALPAAPGSGETVALVAEADAAQARFTAEQILETRSFNQSFLRKLRSNDDGQRAGWLRFVLIKFDSRRARSLLPEHMFSATLLLDRHYISLEPYRRSEPNLYAVHVGGRCAVGYVSLLDRCLVLRQRDPRNALQVVRLERGRSYHEYVIGRVCHLGLDL